MNKENKPENTPETSSGKQKINKVVAVLFGIGFLICAIWLVQYLIGNYQASKQLNELKDAYVTEGSSADNQSEDNNTANLEADSEAGNAVVGDDETVSSGDAGYEELSLYNVPVKEIDFAALQAEQNEDIYAWITIPDTNIDYPILQHPEDPNHYLNYNIDGSKGYPGCIYTELYNSKEWDDPNTVLYGHNMKNGTMFANLHYYEDPEFFEEHPYVYIYSEDAVRVYQIFASYEFSNAHLLICFDTKDPEIFGQYLEGVMQHTGLTDNYNTELVVTAEDQIITLETCIANKPEKRYLVQAVLVATGEVTTGQEQ